MYGDASMTGAKYTWAMILLVLLTLGEIFSMYYAIFFIWIMAHHATGLHELWGRVYIWLAVSLLIGLVWIAVAIWLFRNQPKLA
jgi:hypothetical protein